MPRNSRTLSLRLKEGTEDSHLEKEMRLLPNPLLLIMARKEIYACLATWARKKSCFLVPTWQ